MKVDMTTKGDFNNSIKWLTDVSRRTPMQSLNQIGKQGVSALQAATPIGETGQTAMGWGYKIVKTGTGANLVFYNNAHMDQSVNIAKIMQFGHGTGTGGYVPPIDYINPALRTVFGGAADLIAKEMFK